MKQIVLYLQIIISFFLITAILLQAKGTGLGKAWGGSGEFYRSKRGIEKLFFKITIFLATAFLLISTISAII